MKPGHSHSEHIFGVIKDVFLIILIFAIFYLIDLEVASFVTVICTAILLTRRIILDYNPGFITGHHFIINEKEIIVPNGIDVFDLGKVPMMDYLQRYTEVIRTILAPPVILIIRFCNIVHLEEYDLFLLTEIVRRLQSSDIEVIFSDVSNDVRTQLREFGIEQQLREGNILSNIEDAITRAINLLHRQETG